MAPMEDRLRATLRERIDDVTTQPALYRLVKERAARRRRRRLLAAVPAGAAAFGLALVVPSVLQGSPEVLRIEDHAGPLPFSANSPEHVVTVDASGGVHLRDVTDGSQVHRYDRIEIGGVLPTLSVAPSGRSGVPIAVLGTPQDDPTTETLLRLEYLGPHGRAVTEHHGFAGALAGPVFEGGFALSPDGRWLVTLGASEEDDGFLHLQVRSAATAATAATGGMLAAEPGARLLPRTSFPPGSVLQDWTGSLAASGGLSQVTVLDPDGRVVAVPLVHSGDEAYDQARISPDALAGSTFEAVGSDASGLPLGDRAVAAYASSHLSDDLDGGMAYVVTSGGNGWVVQAVDGEEVLGEVDVTDLIGDLEPSVIALDAWGDTATLSTRDGSWLLTHDGNGRFIEPVALPDGTVRAAPVGRDLAEAAPTDEVDANEVPEDTASERTPPGEPTAPIVQADATTVLLRSGGGAGDITLLDLADQADASVDGVAVRPGSTVDDLTVAALVTEDGVTGLRYVEVVAGEAQAPVTIDDPVLAPNARAEAGLTVHGLAWAPDGASLTWLERLGDGVPTNLRITSWGDGPGTGEGHDSLGWEAPALDGTDARLVDWVDTADGWFVRFLATDGDPGTWVWRFERRYDGSLPDGSLAPVDLASEPTFQSVAPAEGRDPRWEVASLHAFAGYDEVAHPTVRLVDRTTDGLTITGPSQGESIGLPPELTGADDLDAAWLHRLADGHLLLGADGRVFLHDGDGWADLGPAVDAAPVR